jgi:hypothetical protein
MIRALVLRFENNKPIVIMETDRTGIFRQYSQDQANDEWENSWYERNGESLNYSLEMVGHGWSMYEQELINYEGEGKVKIDNALKELGFNKPEDYS